MRRWIVLLLVVIISLTVFSVKGISLKSSGTNDIILAQNYQFKYVYGANGSFPWQAQAMPFVSRLKITSSTVGDVNGDGSDDVIFASYGNENITVYLNNNGNVHLFPDYYFNSSAGVYHPTDVLILDEKIVVSCHNETSTTLNNYDRVKIYNLSGNYITLGVSSNYGFNSPLIIASIVTGDFNGDGNGDIAAAFSTYSLTGNFASRVSIYYSPFTDGQTPNLDLSLGNNISMLSCGDYNGDGRDDLAVISNNGKEVDVFYQKSSGGFNTNPSLIINTNSAVYITSANVTGNNITDLLVSNIATGNISVYEGTSLGLSPDPIFNLTGELGVRAIGVGDFNGDGIPDVVSSLIDEKIVAGAIDVPRYMELFYGPLTNNKSYDAAIFSGYQIRDINVDDINGDGRDDLVICATGDKRDYPSQPYILYQRKNGLKGISDESIYGGIYPTGVAIGDFNGDGYNDIVVTDTALNTTNIFLNQGGYYALSANYTINISGNPLFVSTGLFDGDSLSDFAVTHYTDGNVSVYLSEFDRVINLTTDMNSTYQIHSYDFNKDDATDIAVNSLNDSKLEIFYNQAEFYDGQNPNVIIDLPDISVDFEPINITTSTYPGIAVVLPSEIAIYNQTSPGIYQSLIDIPVSAGYYFSSIGVGDFNGDGQDDIVVTAVYQDGLSSQYDIFFQKNGSFSTFPDMWGDLDGKVNSVATGDFNDDGWEDFSVISSISLVTIFYNNGTSFDRDYLATNQNPICIAAGDLNMDNRTDIIVTSQGPKIDNFPWEVKMVDIYYQKNMPPIARASSNSPIYEGNYINLTAQNTTDGISDLATLNYTWYFWNGSDWNLTGYGINISYYASTQGYYFFKLVVRDRGGLTNETIVNVTVLDTSPIVDFTYSNAIEGQNTTFNATVYAYDGIYAVYWDLNGDGIWDVKNETTFNYTYISNGTYHVNLTAIDNDGSVSYVNKTVFVKDTSPTCNFTYSPQNPIEGENVNFTDESTAYDGIVNWTWSIGGRKFYTKDVQYIFPTQGTYFVNLTVKDSDGSEAWKEVSIIVGDSQPLVNFTYTGTYEGDDFHFYADVQSYDPISSYFWDFGDGSTSEVENPTHVYRQDGVYTVTLWVEDSDGSNVSHSERITVEDRNPSVNFTYTTPVVEGESVQFTAQINSYDGITYLQWDFGDGTTSNDVNPEHIFKENGTYIVKLTVREGDGDKAEKTETVAVEDTSPEIVLKVMGSTTVDEDQKIVLNATGTYAYDGIKEYLWDFNYNGHFISDLNTSTPFAETSYPEKGTYLLALEVIDGDGSYSIKTISINVNNVPPIANFTVDVSGNKVSFDASSTYDTPSDKKTLNYTWDFGDGTYGYGMKVNHTYRKAGDYIVTLIVRDNDGAVSKVSKKITVKGGATVFGFMKFVPWIILALIAGGAIVYIFVSKYRRYTIDDVYLISGGGLLIHHSTRRLKPEMDEDILSSMFVAVQEFIKDSFKDEKDVGLKKLEFGDKTIFIEKGENLYLAVVTSGKPPERIGRKAREVLQEIEKKYKKILEHWDGDVREFTGVEDIMKKIWD